MAGPTFGLRVCDMACDTLAYEFGGKPPDIGWATPFDVRDKSISDTLKMLKLNAP